MGAAFDDTQEPFHIRGTNKSYASLHIQSGQTAPLCESKRQASGSMLGPAGPSSASPGVARPPARLLSGAPGLGAVAESPGPAGFLSCMGPYTHPPFIKPWFSLLVSSRRKTGGLTKSKSLAHLSKNETPLDSLRPPQRENIPGVLHYECFQRSRVEPLSTHREPGSIHTNHSPAGASGKTVEGAPEVGRRLPDSEVNTERKGLWARPR